MSAEFLTGQVINLTYGIFTGVMHVLVKVSKTFGNVHFNGVTQVFVEGFKTFGNVHIGAGMIQVFVGTSKTCGNTQVGGGITTGITGATTASKPIGAKGFNLPSFPKGVKEILESCKFKKAISEKMESPNFIFLTPKSMERRSWAIKEF